MLKTRCKKEIEHFINGKKISQKWAIAKESESLRKSNVERLLKDFLEEEYAVLPLNQLVENPLYALHFVVNKEYEGE